VQFWLRKLGSYVPVAIHILSHQIAAIVAQKDPIRIHHGYNFKYKVIPQNGSDGMIPNEKLDEALAHMGSWSLAGMRPAEDYNHPDKTAIQAICRALLGSHVVDGQQVHVAILL